MFQEFKTFVAKGNVMDMAVGIIIGAAFTAIVTSLVGDLLNPIISLFMGGLDFASLFALLGDGEYASLTDAEEAGAAVFAYGRFIMAIINFLIIEFVVFLLVNGVNSMKKKEEEEAPAEPAGPTEIELLMEIRDALKK
ncbi:MAG: large conductance mechanosensitive channel protein MscL [Pseudomonadota bacterium]